MVDVENKNTVSSAKRILETTSGSNEVDDFTGAQNHVADALLNSQFTVHLAPAELARFNYLQRSTLTHVLGWGYTGDGFKEYTGYTPEQFTERNLEYALKVKTKDLFTPENDGGASLADTERLVEESSRKFGEMDRHLAAEIIEHAIEGRVPQDISLLLSAAQRLETNGEGNFQNVLQGIIDARREENTINKDVAEVVLRTAVQDGAAGHWPADVICPPDRVIYTDPKHDPDGEFPEVRQLSAYNFGLALGSMIDDDNRRRISEGYGDIRGLDKTP